MPSPGLTPQSANSTDFSAFDKNTNRLNRNISAQANVTYDDAGNLTHDAGAGAYIFDGENRLTNFNSGAGKYFYDGDGRRVKKIDNTGTTIFVYNAGGQLIAEYTTATPAAGDTSYLTTDHLGSTRLVTDCGGNVKARYDYLPFGEEIGANIGTRTAAMGYSANDKTRQKFTQKERDSESGLDYFLERYYSSAQGRFTSPDEPLVGQHEPDPQSWSLYGYARNNPLIYIDPTGTDYVLFGPNGNIMHVKDQFFEGPLPKGYEVIDQNREGTYIELKDPSGNIWRGNFRAASNFKDTGRDFDFSIFDFRQHLERVQEDLRTPFVSHLHDGNQRPDPLDSTKFYKNLLNREKVEQQEASQTHR